MPKKVTFILRKGGEAGNAQTERERKHGLDKSISLFDQDILTAIAGHVQANQHEYIITQRDTGLSLWIIQQQKVLTLSNLTDGELT